MVSNIGPKKHQYVTVSAAGLITCPWFNINLTLISISLTTGFDKKPEACTIGMLY